jgi:RNA-directed DNA polymerase
MGELYEKVRSAENLHAAWRHVRRSAQSSKNDEIRGHASEFEHQHQRHIDRIARQLREGRFKFDDVEGVLKDKKKREKEGKDPRPLIVATITSRVVQRAILQVLQPRGVVDPTDPNTKHVAKIDKRLGRLNDVNRSRYGVGGLMRPYGGVGPAIDLVMTAMRNGAIHYFQSDIKAFFTKIRPPLLFLQSGRRAATIVWPICFPTRSGQPRQQRGTAELREPIPAKR